MILALLRTHPIMEEQFLNVWFDMYRMHKVAECRRQTHTHTLCFALLCSGHGVKAGPPPRSVERPHPDILRGWAWLYRGKTLKCNEEKRRVPGRQQKHALITGPASLVLAAVALHL